MRNPFKTESKYAPCEEKMPTEEQEEEVDENARGNWSRPIEKILCFISYAVGFGNIWRFPFLCMRNGGGAFLIPYFTCLFLVAMPLFYMESSIAQFGSLSPLNIWKLCPIFSGLGWGACIVTAIFTIIFNIIVAWVLYYLVYSFAANLVYASCDNWWNTPGCSLRGALGNMTEEFNYTAGNFTEGSTTPAYISENVSGVMEIYQIRTPTEEFWHFNCLQLSSGLHELGSFRWQLVLGLVLSWTFLFLCLVKGVKSLGKVSYVTSTVPYLFLTALLVRGITLPGALLGIEFYLYPHFYKLLEFRVWIEAFMQVFFSLGPGWGGIITLSSYSKFNNNIHLDSFVVPLINSFTSFYAGFVVFSVLGHLALESKLPVSEVITSGPGLAFIAYPEAISRLPISPLWAIIFFAMLLNLGLGTQLGMFETISSGLIDQWPDKLLHHKAKLVAFLCITGFCCSLPLATQGGMYIFQVIDWYAGAFSVIFICVCECIAVAWCYGVDRLAGDIKMMTGRPPYLWFKISWKYICPFMLSFMLIASLFKFVPPNYGAYEYPVWARIIGWSLAMVSIIPVPILAIWQVYHETGPILQRIKKLSRPTDDWGPALEQNRYDYNERMGYKGAAQELQQMGNNTLPLQEKEYIMDTNSEKAPL